MCDKTGWVELETLWQEGYTEAAFSAIHSTTRFRTQKGDVGYCRGFQGNIDDFAPRKASMQLFLFMPCKLSDPKS